MNNCTGCGDTIDIGKTLCERCFRIRNYNDYKQVIKTNNDFIPILEDISKTKDLVVLVVDLFDVGDLSNIVKYLSNDILLVLTKRDILPKRVYDVKLLDYSYGIKCVDKIIVSSKKNYQFDELLEKIDCYKKSNNVYVVGYTNAGKSTLINKLLYNYSSNDTVITTSPLPSTTLNKINIVLDDNLTFIDTPGLLEEKDFIHYLSGKDLKKIVPNKEINALTYQVKGKQYFLIDEFAYVEAENIDLTFYMSNNLNIKRVYKDINCDMTKHILYVDKEDIVIKGLGFIKTKQKGVVVVYTLHDVLVFTRPSLI